MEGDLHGLALLLVIITAAVLCYRYGRAPQLVLPTFVIWLVGGFFAMLVLHHLVFLLVHVVWNDLSSAAQIAITFATHQAVILLVCLALVWRALTLTRAQKLLLIGSILLLGGLSLLHMQRATQRQWNYCCIPTSMAWIRESARPYLLTPHYYWHSVITGIGEKGTPLSNRQTVLMAIAIMQSIQPKGMITIVPPPIPEEIGENFREGMTSGTLKAWVDERYNQGVGSFVMVIGVMLTVLLLIRYARWDDISYPLRKRFVFGLCVGAVLCSFGTNIEVIPLTVMAVCLTILGWWLPNRAQLQVTMILLFLLPTIALSWLSTL